MTTANPFMAYTQAKIEDYKMPVASLYEDSVEAFQKATQKPKQKVFNSMAKLLQESYFIGATRFGNNFIG